MASAGGERGAVLSGQHGTHVWMRVPSGNFSTVGLSMAAREGGRRKACAHRIGSRAFAATIFFLTEHRFHT